VQASPTTFIGSTEIRATIPASQLQKGTILRLSVSTSSAIAINNPVPGAITLTPASAIAGTGTAQITIAGSSIVPSTVVYVNGQPRTTTYVNAGQLVA
jgi:hypothetical protein